MTLEEQEAKAELARSGIRRRTCRRSRPTEQPMTDATDKIKGVPPMQALTDDELARLRELCEEAENIMMSAEDDPGHEWHAMVEGWRKRYAALRAASADGASGAGEARP